MRILLFVSLVFSFRVVQAHELRVRVFSSENTQQVQIVPLKGSYTLRPAAEDTVAALLVRSVAGSWSGGLGFSVSGSRIRMKEQSGFSGLQQQWYLKSAEKESTFLLRVGKKEGVYKGQLELTVVKGKIQLVNIIDLETYVAGVVESEGGHEAQYEYFKAQAVLARTFALRNRKKHQKEGFHLCDQVHCQAYKNICHGSHCKAIEQATAETAGLILTDRKGQPIIAAFHANCGGQTVNSEDAWQEAISYLRSHKDTFCIGQAGAKWEKRITKTSYLNYFKTWVPKETVDSSLWQELLSHAPTKRKTHYTFFKKSLALKTIRKQFRLRSTWFSAHEDKDHVLLKGRGYGHGVGLCQEGAMQMARLHYCFDEILYFYYRSVNLEPIPDLN